MTATHTTLLSALPGRVADGSLAGWSRAGALGAALRTAAHALATGKWSHYEGVAVSDPEGTVTVWRRLKGTDRERGPAYALCDHRFGAAARKDAWAAVRKAHVTAAGMGVVYLRAGLLLPADPVGRELALDALRRPREAGPVFADWLEERHGSPVPALRLVRRPGETSEPALREAVLRAMLEVSGA